MGRVIPMAFLNAWADPSWPALNPLSRPLQLLMSTSTSVGDSTRARRPCICFRERSKKGCAHDYPQQKMGHFNEIHRSSGLLDNRDVYQPWWASNIENSWINSFLGDYYSCKNQSSHTFSRTPYLNCSGRSRNVYAPKIEAGLGNSFGALIPHRTPVS
jgi:hypothetical protein